MYRVPGTRDRISSDDLSDAVLSSANLGNMSTFETIFENVNLIQTIVLATREHHGSSSSDHQALERTQQRRV